MLKRLLSSIIVWFACISPLYAAVHQYTVSPKDIHNGYFTVRIPLAAYATPEVKVQSISHVGITGLAKNTILPASQEVKLIMGMERKRPFVIVQVPAYKTEATQVLQILSVTLNVIEKESASVNAAAVSKGASVSSPLASGNWYKIAVPARGIYKIDYNFIQNTLGVSAGSITPSNIRIFGNGGIMLSENNAVARPDNLTENAIQVIDGGDGAFNSGDYILFYATGPMGWDADVANNRFIHRKHLYSDSSYYFINFDGTSGLRIGNQSSPPTANKTVTTYNEYQVHEQDLNNPGKFGKTWYGEKFGNYTTVGLNSDVNFGIGAGVDSIKARITTVDKSSLSGASFNVSVNGQTIFTPTFSAIGTGEEDPPVSVGGTELRLPVTNGNANFHLTYNPSVADGAGFLDFIELNYRRQLNYGGGVMTFRDLSTVGSGNVASYSLSGAGSNVQVWDVTNPLKPVNMNVTASGSGLTFSQDAGTLHEFVAQDGTGFSTARYIGHVVNQDIHGQPAADLIIVTHPDFKNAANRLADFHRQHDGLRCLTVTTDQVYNEFSSGAQDITAIRDMARYFYVRAGVDTTQMPRYLLLLGDASYDYKDRISGNTNYVPTYESDESINVGLSYVVDEFYAMLDDNEDIRNNTVANTLDLGVGRLPVTSPEEADAVVNKIIVYAGPASFGPWKLNNTYIGDNEDNAGAHMSDADFMAGVVDRLTHHLYNDNKIYLDNLPFISTPGGLRCPDANKAINDAIYKGTFLINYNGHGNTQTLAHERILTATDFSTWKNLNKLPFMVTATCDFSRYDDPSYRSAGEMLAIKADGGAIAQLTTTAAVYASVNHTINESYLRSQFTQHADGSWPSFGDAYRRGKNETYINVPDFGTLLNFRRFILLGDPALVPNFPTEFVATDSLTDMNAGIATDTIKALGNYKLTGHIADANGLKINDFNGRAYVTIYDKYRVINLLTKEYQQARTYTMQDNIIYKGIATVTNGSFSVNFIAPKDLNYDFAFGKISYYAENGVRDAAGVDTMHIVGGYSDNPIADNSGPIVQPYMNDTLFRDGGLTGSNTLLFVKLQDATGINVSGNSVGHDLIAILDGNVGAPYNLNDYYVTAPNTYQLGYVRFPVTGLTNGQHSFLVRAWDVNNNSGEGTVHFEVRDGNVVAIQNLMNYPNPFSDVTHFVFEHNHPNEVLKVQIAIYASDGRSMRLLEQTFTPSGSHSNELTWDGTDANGGKLPSGVYPYRMILSTDKGVQTTAYQKLVIIR